MIVEGLGPDIDPDGIVDEHNIVDGYISADGVGVEGIVDGTILMEGA